MPRMSQTRIYRIDVTPTGDIDPLGRRVAGEARSLGLDVAAATSRRVYLLETDADADAVRDAAMSLLADGVAESATFTAPGDAVPAGDGRVEIHLKPGVMDPVAQSCVSALARRGLEVAEVRTGRAFDFADAAHLEDVASRVLANGVIESVHFGPYFPDAFAHGHPYHFALRHVPLLGLDDAGLAALSRDGHLFLSLAEMRAVQTYFETQGREPTDVELETVAQTWSEHCVHKTLKSAVVVEDESGNELRRYGNLIRDTIFASTQQLMKQRDDGFCLSVFKDNAGVIAFDEVDGVCFKVETHNRPSAIEPYGGAATGIGGVIRDVLGTGLGAKPVANTDVFCVAPPEDFVEDFVGWASAHHSAASTAEADGGLKPTLRLPPGVIPPARVLSQIAAGVRDYGNRMGIPTVNGAIHYHPDYVANPLVFCGCVGILPRAMVEKEVNAGDRIVVMGGRTGRDGIHGATFSSAELTDTHGSEFAHAVQIGNAITEKQVMDVLLQARDAGGGGLFTSVTDCGAGGLSSAVGEMGEKLGASVELASVPLKYAGLRYDEIWISEAQERMVLSVPPDKLAALLSLAESEGVEATDIGVFGTPDRELVLQYDGHAVGRLAMSLLHDGIPMPQRRATLPPPDATTTVTHRAAAQPNPSVQEPNRSPQELNRSPQELNRSPQELNRSPQELNRSPQELNRSPQELNRSPQELNRSPQELNRSTQEPDRSIQELNRSTQEPNRSVQELNRSIQEPNDVNQEPNDALQPALRADALPRVNDAARSRAAGDNLRGNLLAALAAPDVRSKHGVVRQYDHEVLGGSVVKPFVGPLQLGPSDAAVIRPKLDSRRGVAISCGLAPRVADPYDMAIAAIDEAVRNAICVGADLNRLALLDNFCWPGTDSPEAMGTLVRACEACRDAALAFGTPFVSGKDSLHNQFTDKASGRVIRIPATLLISAIGIVEDVAGCVTSDLKRAGEGLFLVRPPTVAPTLEERRAVHAYVASQIAGGAVTAAHDVSDGGWLVAAAEMCIGGNLGLDLTRDGGAFDESPTTYLLAGEVADTDVAQVTRIGTVTATPQISVGDEMISLSDCTRAWRGS